MVYLSELKDDEKLLVCWKTNYDGSVTTVGDFINDLNYYKSKDNLEVYTAYEYHASIDAEDMLNSAIENEACDNMYEDWDENIRFDITKEDIEDVQRVLNRLFDRSPGQNISYHHDERVEVDL